MGCGIAAIETNGKRDTESEEMREMITRECIDTTQVVIHIVFNADYYSMYDAFVDHICMQLHPRAQVRIWHAFAILSNTPAIVALHC